MTRNPCFPISEPMTIVKRHLLCLQGTRIGPDSSSVVCMHPLQADGASDNFSILLFVVKIMLEKVRHL